VFIPQHILHSIAYKLSIEKEQANCFDSVNVYGATPVGAKAEQISDATLEFCSFIRNK